MTATLCSTTDRESIWARQWRNRSDWRLTPIRAAQMHRNDLKAAGVKSEEDASPLGALAGLKDLLAKK